MPPRFVYWTIIAGGLPTAFRATDREELLPTFKQIHQKHPDAVMKYFARGQLWESEEQAKQAAQARRAKSQAPKRGADWRPGGQHRDPRQKFKDARKAKNLDRRKRRFERRSDAPALPEGPKQKPHGDPLRRHVRRRPESAGGRPPRRKPDPRRRRS